jgi:hypothetical protein
MIEQWFLDLDGVRSGPYQTPEVMSLIAEGEVLPHHRISTSLRDQRWVTILDWRLDQAKISAQTSNPSPFSTSRSEVSSVEGLEYVLDPIPEIEMPSDTVISAEKFEIIEPVHEVAPPQPEISPPHDTDVGSKPEIKMTAEPIELAVDPSPTPKVKLPSQASPLSSSFHEEKSASSQNDSAPKPRRDPMGEMFDLIQNSKQKRDSKQNAQALSGILIEHDVPATAKSGGFMRTLMIGGGITLVGFALGQLFQQSAPPVIKDSPASLAKTSPFATPPASTPAAAVASEVIDRSNDKMTIKTTVTHAKTEPKPVDKFNSKNLHTPAENVQNEKELEELKNLKKELQELKALKNNGAGEDTDIVGPEGDGFDAREPGPDYPKNYPPNPGGIPSTYQSEGEVPQPGQQPGAGQNLMEQPNR